jgi:iron complex outermembrane recepter protein
MLLGWCSGVAVSAVGIGNRLPDTLNFTASVFLEYNFNLLGGISTLHIDDAVNSGYFSDPDNELRQPAFNVINASWRLGTQDERYYGRLRVMNLGDKRYSYQLEASNIQYAESYAPPRTYGVTIGVKF